MKVKELFTIQKGKKVVESPVSNNENICRYIQIEDLRNDENMKYGIGDKRSVYATKQDIIIAWDGANAGTIGYGLEGLVGSTLAVLRPKVENIYVPYVGKYLKSKSQYLRDNCTGATIPHIQKQVLEQIDIPLPDLEEQKRIAAVLGKAQELIDKRKEAVAKLDELVQAVFLDMFGDVYVNEKQWTKKKIGDVVTDIISGWSVDGEEREKQEDEVAVLKISAVTKGEFDPGQYKVISKEKELKKVVTPNKGDILFSRANTRELVGACCIVDRDYFNLILPDKLWKIVLDESMLTSHYFKMAVTSKGIKNEISKKASGTSGSMLNISMQKLKDISIPIPNIETQMRFSNIYENIVAKKVQNQKSLHLLQASFNSLLQQAFKGELQLKEEVLQ